MGEGVSMVGGIVREVRVKGTRLYRTFYIILQTNSHSEINRETLRNISREMIYYNLFQRTSLASWLSINFIENRSRSRKTG